MSVEINCPAENYPQTVVSGTGASGYISAFGEAFLDEVRYPHILVRLVYSTVPGIVYPGFHDVGTGDVSDQHDPNAVSVDQPGTGATTVWYLPQVPGAICAQTGAGPVNTLVVWAKFPGLVQEVRAFRHFTGICGAQTSCPPPNEAFAARERAPVMPAILPLTTAPVVWQVKVDGFSGPGSEAFNGTWSLKLRGTDRGICSWDNGGDGVSRTLVRLSCESPIASSWHLTWRLGAEQVSYRASAAAWYLLSVNVLALSPDETTCACQPPSSSTVTPG
jgi:hypothetical protein